MVRGRSIFSRLEKWLNAEAKSHNRGWNRVWEAMKKDELERKNSWVGAGLGPWRETSFGSEIKNIKTWSKFQKPEVAEYKDEYEYCCQRIPGFSLQQEEHRCRLPRAILRGELGTRADSWGSGMRANERGPWPGLQKLPGSSEAHNHLQAYWVFPNSLQSPGGCKIKEDVLWI